jgi:hypothetical protein
VPALAVAATALALAPGARVSSLTVVPKQFSPVTGSLAVSGAVGASTRTGVRLADVRDRPLGWIDAPATRRVVSTYWDGTLNGVRVPDGYYTVQLIAGRSVVAKRTIRIDSVAPALETVAADNGAAPFAGDGPLLTTITPNGDGRRDTAVVRFTLSEAAAVTLEVARTARAPEDPVYVRTRWFRAGANAIEWTPATGLGPRTFLLHLRLTDAAGNSASYGADSPFVARFPRAPVVRLMGVDASFAQPSYAPLDVGVLRVATDAPSLSVQIFRAGPEHVVTESDNVMNGVAAGPVHTIDWRRHGDAPAAIRLGFGPWPSGLYFAQLTAPDGRVGFAPFVLRPATFGEHRVAVVLPAATWQAYNFWDANGDGFGDTWYVGPPHQTVRLDRPFLRRGVIPFFRRYDLGFLHWLAWTGKDVDYIADTDLDEGRASGDELARAYDLIVFPGHTEYVETPLYDAIERYRDLGGNLAFLSANNLFWRITRDGPTLRRAGHWRDLGRPEGSLIGAQYVANDEGHRQGVYVVGDPGAAPWLWDRTGLEAGGTFGEFVGGYGIEIDAAGPSSPPGTRVLAQIPDLFGPGVTAQMTYYETEAGAKVFAAGALDFAGSATFWPVSRILENLWTRLTAP